MSFPWVAKANTKTVCKRDKAPPAPRLRWKSPRSFVLLALTGAASMLDAPAARAEPPVNALPQEAARFVTSGAAAIGERTVNTLTINQQTSKAILNWQSFNIGRNASVTFKQPDASSAALNRIHQGSPSEIYGRLSANGQIYLLNQNGIIFGNGAQINTHSLVATTLDISDRVFNDIGIAGAINQSENQAAFAGADTGFVQIEAGARLESAEGGFIMVFAPRIANAGEIRTPGGQAVLAASRDKVYLARSDDDNLRGLLVEVDTGGDVKNVGKIIAERGNISLVGFAVNQDGLVRATTSADLGGSIRLLARDGTPPPSGTGDNRKPVASRTGNLVLGANSVTEVQPELDGKPAVDGQPQPRSRIEAMGHTIRINQGARVLAPGGIVELTATTRPAQRSIAGGISDSRVFMETDSVIDVSGVDSTVLPMERNLLNVELFANELADSPAQRDGPLNRQTVTIDVRRGTPLASIDAAIEALPRPVGERLATGGQVSIRSEGDVVLQPGAVIDVSGGKVEYQAGFINTTQLISEGRVYDISDADPRRRYDAIYGSYERFHRKWGVREVYNLPGAVSRGRFEPGYVEGKDAGGLTIESNRRPVLDGILRGEVTRGRWQRNPPTSLKDDQVRPYDEVPLGGRFALTVANQREVLFASEVSAQNVTFESPPLENLPLRLAPAALVDGGFNRIDIEAVRAAFNVPADLRLVLQPGGELTLKAHRLDVDGAIEAPGGTVRLTAVAQAEPGELRLGPGGRIDTRGQWINDSPLLDGAPPTAPLFVDGGTIGLTAEGDVTLASGSVLDVSGGAHLRADGKLNPGKGGEIAIESSSPDRFRTPRLVLNGELRGYSLKQGGRLRLKGPGFRIGDGLPPESPSPAEVALRPEFFGQGGFQSFDLTATRAGFTVEDGTQVNLRPDNLELTAGFALRPTGARIEEFSRVGPLPDFDRAPTSLSVNVARDDGVADKDAILRIGAGAGIETETAGTIALKADSDIVIDGSLVAPAGTISLALNAPSGVNERGFRADQAIRLGPQSRLSAQGAGRVRVLDRSGRRLRQGEILSGGRVELDARRGYILAAPGSLIDVSGAAQVLDLPTGNPGQTVPTAVIGAAGAIDLAAAEGILLHGELRGRPGGKDGLGASLALTIDPRRRNDDQAVTRGQNPLPAGPRTIVVGRSADTYYMLGTAIPAELNGVALLDPDRMHSGGFDAVSLRALPVIGSQASSAAIRFEGDTVLEAGRQIRLDAPVVAVSDGAARVQAPYVGIGPSDTINRVTAAAATAGTGRFSVQAEHIDLIGTVAFQGVGDNAETAEPGVELISRGDIRAIGVRRAQNESSRGLPGSLISPAGVSLQAAQIYPATLTDYEIAVLDPEGTIRVKPNDSSAESQAPLSAAGRLKLTATHIVQEGVLRAPFGELQLNAEESLTLARGSMTSTSGAGITIPFGRTEIGDWVYKLDGQFARVFEDTPQKRVDLKAAAVNIEPGAVIDLTGGGDLLAHEFIPGPGGSRDVLRADNSEGAFAILPAYASSFGIYDPLESPHAGIAAGDTITLAGGGAVPAGEYAILPARYALLPGAFLVRPAAGTQDSIPGRPQQTLDGMPVIAGRRGTAGRGPYESRWNGYIVENGVQARARAEYAETLASKFFARTESDAEGATAGLPDDAGQLVIDAGRALTLGGTLATNTGSGRGSEVDIVADNLAVVTAYTGTADRVELLVAGLNQLNADSLLLGATRTRQAADVALDVKATDVTVADGAALSAPEVMLAAKQQVNVNGGATITAKDGDRVRAPASIELTGDGALARVSSGEQVRVQRTASPGTGGRVTIAAGALLDAARSITLDASADTVVDGEMRTDNGSISLAASRVSLGETQGVSGGLVMSNDKLARINARELLLNSRSTIDLYGQVAVENLNRIALDAAGLAGYNNVGKTASFSADAIALSNRFGRAYTSGAAGAPNGTGTLNLAAREVTLGEGEFTIRGFGDTTLAAAEQIIARPETDTPVNLRVAGDLTLQAPRITARHGADVRIATRDASGATVGRMTLAAAAAPATLDAVTELGAKLELESTAIDQGTRIELPSGIVALRATGPGGVNVADNAVIDVSGRDLAFADITVGSPGGNVSLVADQGNVRIGAARIDVSGAPSGGDAGKLAILAPQGEVELHAAATLAAKAQAGSRAGSFALDTQRLTNGFSALIAAVNDVQAGFTEDLMLRLRSGDVALGSAIKAHDFKLVADGGRIDVTGAIDATGDKGGSVVLSAANGITLAAGAVVDASAEGAGKDGGTVDLQIADGNLIVSTGATIDVAGGPAGADGTRGADGKVRLRLPRAAAMTLADQDATNDRLRIDGTINGAGATTVEALQTYTVADGSIDAADIATTGSWYSNAAAFMGNAPNIAAGLGKTNDSRFHIVPGIELQTNGNLALNTGWDLFNWRFGPAGEPGVLTLRAAGDLQLNQSLSDGFARQSIAGRAERDVVQIGPSWSYRLVAGASLAAADPLAVVPDDGVGSVTLANGVHVRTGTGDISVAAGKDVVLRSPTSTLYTAGENRGTGTLDPSLAELVLRGDFVHRGGDIDLFTAGNIRGVTGQILPDWLPRYGGPLFLFGNDFPAAWAVDVAQFQQGIGALGGGNVRVRAGGDIQALSVAIPTTGQPTGNESQPVAVAGGGDLEIEAGGDIRGGVFTMGRGRAAIRAGGAIAEAAGGSGSLAPILMVGDAQYELQARKRVALETAFNPTLATPKTIDFERFVELGQDAIAYFSTYSDRSAIGLTSLADDVEVRADIGDIAALHNDRNVQSDRRALTLFPGSLTAQSLQGDVRLNGSITLYPSPRGALRLMADGDLTGAGARILLSDADVNLLPTLERPQDGVTNLGGILAGHAPRPVHGGDAEPVRIVARAGSIGSRADVTPLHIDVSKHARLFAGRDIANLRLLVQHADEDAVTQIEAGRDIVFSSVRNLAGGLIPNDTQINISGPGRAELLAGRDVDLGSSSGVISTGDRANPALADSGASITIVVGQKQQADYEAFIQRYLVDSDAYRESLARFLGKPGVTEGDIEAFRALPQVRQRQFIFDVFFNELRETGIAAAESTNYERGFTAIKTLFPAESYPGDIKSFLSQITTADGGDINLVVPGGLVNAGVTSNDALGAKRPDKLGIVVARDGDINAFVHGDFLVNQSRVFALDGGDIVIWSSTGNIDAGRGAKTALSIPAPNTTTDENGITTVEFPAVISGSGIRGAVSTPGREPGDVILIAPAGVVNAGDAGIGSAGNLTIAATAVIGADNIQVGGASFGVPLADAGGLGAALSGVSGLSSSVAKSAEETVAGSSAAGTGDEDLSAIDVEVVGFGEGGEPVIGRPVAGDRRKRGDADE